MRLILVRHGESTANAAGIIQGQRDYPLSEKGLAQARAAAAKLLRTAGPVSALYTSPLTRARDTATEIGHALGLEAVRDADLMECAAGGATGLTWLEFADRFPEWAHRVANMIDGETIDQIWPGGETTSDCRNRCRIAISRIIQRHPAERDTVIVVAHGGVISWMLAALLEPDSTTWPLWRMPNASISEITVTDGVARAIRIGEVPDAPTGE